MVFMSITFECSSILHNDKYHTDQSIISVLFDHKIITLHNFYISLTTEINQSYKINEHIVTPCLMHTYLKSVKIGMNRNIYEIPTHKGMSVLWHTNKPCFI